MIVEEMSRAYVIDDNLIEVLVIAKIRNRGDRTVSEYIHRLTEREADHIGIFVASEKQTTSRDIIKSMAVTRIGREASVALNQPLDGGSSMTLYMSYTLGSYCLFAKPNVSLNQKITLFFNTTLFYRGPYPVEKSTIMVDGISRSSIVNLTEHPALTVLPSSIRADALEQATDEDLEVVFTTSRSLLRVNKVVTRTSVSHWGKTKQEVFYDISNAGPEFIGKFNEVDFLPHSSPCYVQTLTLIPPDGAYDPWATDDDGPLENDMSMRFTELDVPLRKPIMSGWNTTFAAGWTAKTDVFVSHNKGYKLQAAMLTPIQAAPIVEAVTEFLLPEGAVVKDIDVPIEANISQYTEVQNLDWSGRRVVRITVYGLATTDVIPITIQYELHFSHNYVKIWFLGTAFCVLFVTIAVCRRSIPEVHGKND